jgi:hypothetical protein
MITIREYFTDPDHPTFLRFGALVNRQLVERCGLGVLDLPDQDYSSLHEEWDGTDRHAFEMADEILENEGFDLGDDW